MSPAPASGAGGGAFTAPTPCRRSAAGSLKLSGSRIAFEARGLGRMRICGIRRSTVRECLCSPEELNYTIAHLSRSEALLGLGERNHGQDPWGQFRTQYARTRARTPICCTSCTLSKKTTTYEVITWTPCLSICTPWSGNKCKECKCKPTYLRSLLCEAPIPAPMAIFLFDDFAAF